MDDARGDFFINNHQNLRHKVNCMYKLASLKRNQLKGQQQPELPVKLVCSIFSVLMFPLFVIYFDFRMFQFCFIYAKCVSFYESQTSVYIFETLVPRKALVKTSGVTGSKPMLKGT